MIVYIQSRKWDLISSCHRKHTQDVIKSQVWTHELNTSHLWSLRMDFHIRSELVCFCVVRRIWARSVCPLTASSLCFIVYHFSESRWELLGSGREMWVLTFCMCAVSRLEQCMYMHVFSDYGVNRFLWVTWFLKCINILRELHNRRSRFMCTLHVGARLWRKNCLWQKQQTDTK